MFKGLVVVFIVFSSCISHAEDSFLWKTVAGWEIRVDSTLGNGCYTTQIYDGDIFFRVGMDKLDGGMYVMIGDQDWKSLEEGKNYPIKIYFGNASPWVGDASALSFYEFPSLILRIGYSDSANAAEFFEEFMTKTFVEIEYNDKSLAKLSLEGTYKAGLEMMVCQQSVDKMFNSPDPFANPGDSSTDSDDPFATSF